MTDANLIAEPEAECRACLCGRGQRPPTMDGQGHACGRQRCGHSQHQKATQMPFKIQTDVDDIPAFLVHHISRILDEAGVANPRPTAGDIRYEPTRRGAEIDVKELTWSIDIGDGFSVPLLVLLGDGMAYDRDWFLKASNWFAVTAGLAVELAENFKESYTRLAPLAREGFESLRLSGCEVRLIDVSIHPVILGRKYGGILVEWESLDENGKTTKGFWDIGSEEDLDRHLFLLPLMLAYEARWSPTLQ